MSMTACFWLRCRRKVSRIYGMSAIIIESDWDAKANKGKTPISLYSLCTPRGHHAPRCFAVMFRSPAERIAPAPSTTWHVRELNDLSSSITRAIVSVVSSERFAITLRYSTSSTSTSSVAPTAKNARSSTRRCFVGAFADRRRALRPGDAGAFGEAGRDDVLVPLTLSEGEDGAGVEGGMGERVSGGGRLSRSSGGLAIEASTMMSTAR